MTGQPIPFAKGHGTGNDFVLLPDLDGGLEVTPARVAALCDRRRGLGADGVLVVARTAGHPEVAEQAGVAPYFMDYRNADGSVAEMCGNGSRVFVAYLLGQGLVGPGPFLIATRGGPRHARVEGTSVVIDMGSPQFIDGQDIEVRVDDGPLATAGIPADGVLMPNPHAVVWVDDVHDAGRLLDAPVTTPVEVYPAGVNVEFVHEISGSHIQMRVFERGVGETLSCGTGACAAAVATIRRGGGTASGQRVRVDVPGGTVEVQWRSDGGVELRGPAVIVASGTIDRQWWEGHV